MMGFTRDKETLLGAFGSKDKMKEFKMKKTKQAREEFLNQEVFGLTGKLIKRSKGFR